VARREFQECSFPRGFGVRLLAAMRAGRWQRATESDVGMMGTRAGVPAVASLVKVRRKGGLSVDHITVTKWTPCSVTMVEDKAPDL
jgi:hypothetical protein